MPRISKKTKIIDVIVSNCLMEMMDLDFDCDEEVEDEILDNCITQLGVVLAKRYTAPINLNVKPVQKSRKWSSTVLVDMDDERFKFITGMTRHTFTCIHNEIKNDPLFNNPHSNKQLPSELQLAIFLYRLGTSGESNTVTKIAALFGVGDGGTVENVSRRVIKTLLHRKKKFLCWPNEEERKRLVNKTFAELPHCVGYLGGSEVRLAEKPVKDWELYYSQKNNYSIKVQVVCDYKLRIRDIVVGPPGSIHGATIHPTTELAQVPDKYFAGIEWLAAEIGYPLTQTVITPFRSAPLDERKIKFNEILSSYTVRVQNSFGVVKERFTSLQELKIQIKDSKSFGFACDWITVACILHNMLIEYSNDIEEILEAVKLRDADDNYEDGQDVEADDTPATRKRQSLMQILLSPSYKLTQENHAF